MPPVSPLGVHTPFCALPSPLFGGTGENGKIRVVVARKNEEFIQQTLDVLKYLPDQVEITGTATSSRGLERLLRDEATRPDVAIVGSTLGWDTPPIQTITQLVESKAIKPLGVILHSVLSPSWATTRAWAEHLLETGKERTNWHPFQFVADEYNFDRVRVEEVDGRRVIVDEGQIEDMKKALAEADPYPNGI